MNRVLEIVGMFRRWAITKRGLALKHHLGLDWNVELCTCRQVPESPAAYDIVHIHSPGIIRRIMNKPGWRDYRLWGFEIISERDRHIEAASKEIARAAFCVVKNPRYRARAEAVMRNGSEIRFIPNGVDNVVFYPRPFVIGWCGNKRRGNAEYKGLPMIREAVKRVKKRLRNHVCVRFVTDPGCGPKRVASTGEIAAWYRTLDAYISASKGEGCSNTLNEACATGLPVVTTDAGNVPELRDGCGLIVVDRTVEGLVDGLMRLLTPIVQRRKTMAKRTWKRVAEQYAELYRKVLQK